MAASVFKQSGHGAGIIAQTFNVPTGRIYLLISVSCVFAVAPTTSEDYTITIDANAGAAYDLLLYTVDPSVGSVTDILWQPDELLYLEGGDAVDVAFAGTDGAGWAVQVVIETA